MATDLLRELEDSNLFFDDMVELFPAKLYIAGNSGDGAYNNKYHKGQSKESKEARRARNKAAKRAKYDPNLQETTKQTKERLQREEEEEEEDEDSDNDEQELKRIRLVEAKAASSDNDGGDEEDEGDGENPPLFVTPSKYHSRIEALRAKLKIKLEEKRRLAGKAPLGTNNNGDDDAASSANGGNSMMISKRAARRAEKERRKQEAMARKKKSSTKLRDQKTAFVMNQQRHQLGGMALSSSASPAAADLAGMDFGKLTGLNADMDQQRQSQATLEQVGNGTKPSKSLHQQLAEAEAKRQELIKLQSSSNPADRSKAQSMHWDKMLKEADGTRIKDDPAKLRKALKRKQKSKEKSQQAWATRTSQTQQSMDERQAIRTHNLQQRKVGGSVGANLSKKRIKTSEDGGGGGGGDNDAAGSSKKRGASSDGVIDAASRKKRRRSRAGFEGKKLDFLNGNNKKESGRNKRKD